MNPANDPFLSHAQAASRQREEMTNMAEGGAPPNRDPFFLHQAEPPSGRQQQQLGDPSSGLDSVQADPFLTRSHPYDEAPRREEAPRMQTPKLGPGDPEKKTSAGGILVFMPWLLFVVVLVIWLVLRHFSETWAYILTILLVVSCLVMIVAWFLGWRFGAVSLLTLGLLCLTAVVLGIVLGNIGWDGFFRQFWWMHTGHWTEKDNAQTLAGARVDAAVIGFWDTDAKNRTMNGTLVDYSRSAGYTDGDRYCVAPVLNPDSISGGLIRVNFWAVGINCCQNIGAFSCGDSRVFDGGYGIVALDGGFPSPTRNNERFKKAVEKAEAAHNLVSSSGAIHIQWVKNPHGVMAGLFWRGMVFAIITVVLMFCICLPTGSCLWYYGIGRASGMGHLGASSSRSLTAARGPQGSFGAMA